ncbi:MAG TPA: heavy metal translocating P-type ATPase [Candidatus Saccharimonadales bacterium]|nr:heavy metal translocating P-type ATPase [Candidatus Saccharimonadales bacterium]
MLKKLWQFFKEYKWLGIVIIALIMALVLEFSKRHVLAHWILGVISIIATLPLLWDMIETIRSGGYGLDILAVTAIVASVALGEYWAGIIIVLMLTGGEALEDYAEERAKIELTDLLKRKPLKAHRIKGNRTSDVSVKQIAVGDKLVIYPGEVVPVDGVIVEGTSSFDESSLTGESLPAVKNIEDQLLSGSINIEGAVTVRALHTAADSQFEQIIKLVKAAASSQSPFVRLADKYSIPFTVTAFIIAGAAWVISGQPIRFLEVLVVATPCPLLLAAPIALISGMSRSAKHGIIVKTGSALEKLAQIKTIAFDKTGTLTQGRPTVSTVQSFNSFSGQEVLGLAAALEQNSTHVLAQSITSAAQKKSIKIPKAKQIKEIAGHGLSGRVQGKTVLVGRLSLLREHDVSIPKSAKLESIQQTATFVSINDRLAGVISFKDELRPDAKNMLKRLRSIGIKHTLMVTGDNEATAKNIAKQVGIEDVRANCLPADKLRAIEAIKYRPVAFVGDGVNDAPVLTASDVGIALGARGSTAASESADVVIMLDDISKVATGIEIANRTFYIAKQSILVGIFISLGLMGVFFTGKFKPVYGAVLQEFVDVTVIFNALRAHGSWRTKSS